MITLTFLCLSLLANTILIIRLVAARDDLAIVTRHLVRIARAHTERQATLRDLQRIITEQDRALCAQRALLKRARWRALGAPVARGGVWVNGCRREALP